MTDINDHDMLIRIDENVLAMKRHLEKINGEVVEIEKWQADPPCAKPMDKRMKKLENWRYYIMGVIAAVTLVGVVIKYF